MMLADYGMKLPTFVYEQHHCVLHLQLCMCGFYMSSMVSLLPSLMISTLYAYAGLVLSVVLAVLL